MDGGFASEEIFSFLESCPRLDYAINFPKNQKITKKTRTATHSEESECDHRDSSGDVSENRNELIPAIPGYDPLWISGLELQALELFFS